MKYEVKKNGRVYMSTQHESCCYPRAVEASLQAAGYEIYIDGKRKKKITGRGSDREQYQ